jgi:hypothetical protein
MRKIIVQIIKKGSIYRAYDIDGGDFTSQISTTTRKKAYENDNALEKKLNKNDEVYWSQVPLTKFDPKIKTKPKKKKKPTKTKLKNTSPKIIDYYPSSRLWGGPHYDTLNLYNVLYSNGKKALVCIACPLCHRQDGDIQGPFATHCPQCQRDIKRPVIFTAMTHEELEAESKKGDGWNQIALWIVIIGSILILFTYI